MKLALEALEDTLSDDPYPYSLESKAITAMREALAKPDFWEGYVPEPVKPAQQLVDCHATGVCVQSGLRAEQPAQQEPVATITITQRGPIRIIDNNFDDCVRGWPDGEYNLYTSPQPAQRTWVGLFWGELPEDGQNHDFLRGAVWAETKLKEKNT